MRVTNRSMASQYLRNLNRQTSKVQKFQDQLSSLKEVSRPSDDPLAVSKIIDLNDSIIQNENFLDTINDGIDWTNVQDAALGQATNAIANIRILVQSAATDTMAPEDRQAVKSNILGEIDSLMDSLNTSFGGRYVFSGQNTTTKPFDIDATAGLTYTSGNKDNLPREVSPGVTVDLLTDGSKLLSVDGETGSFELGAFFNEVLTALDNNDTEALSGKLMDDADAVLGNIVDKRAEIGAVFNRLESAKGRNETENINLYSMRSNKQDIDLAEKFMEYTMEMTAYNASLQMGTRILQTNILNYL